MCLLFIFCPRHAVNNSYTIYICFLTLSCVFVYCDRALNVPCWLSSGKASSWLGRRFVCKEFLRQMQSRLSLCLPFFDFPVARLPAGLVAASSARNSWAALGQSIVKYPMLTSWSWRFHPPEMNDSRRSYEYQTLYWSSYRGCPMTTLCSSSQGTTSGLTFYPEKLRRLCASMLFWVMFICRVGVSSSCAMAVMCTGMSIVFCSSDESPQTSIHSSTNTFFNVSPVGIQFTYNRPSETLFLFPGALKCWCGTIATMFSQAPRRDSQDLHCFSLVVVPSRWWRQLHVVRAIKYEWPSQKLLAKWRKLPGGVRRGFHVAVPRILILFEGLLLSVFLYFWCLAHALSARCFPSCRPDTASFRSCLLLPPGFLGTREAGICAGSRAWFSFSFSSFGSARGGLCPVISGSVREMSLQALMKFEGPATVWNYFWVLPHSRCLLRSSTIYAGYAQARSKSTTFCCSECVSHHCG